MLKKFCTCWLVVLVVVPQLFAQRNIIGIPKTDKNQFSYVSSHNYNILGTFWFAPEGVNSSESRYVQLLDRIIVGDRISGRVSCFSTLNLGGVPDSTGESFGPPFNYPTRWVLENFDKSGDGKIQTSSDSNCLSWENGFQPNDERILWSVLLPCSNIRHLTDWFNDSTILAGGTGSQFFYILDIRTGIIVDSINVEASAGYGGIKQDSYVWSAGNGNVIRIDQQKKIIKISVPGVYGITGLSKSGDIVVTNYNEHEVIKIDSGGNIVNRVSIGKNARGIAYSGKHDLIYVANSTEGECTILDTNLTVKKSFSLSFENKQGIDPTGIAVNAWKGDDEVLVVCRGNSKVFVASYLGDIIKVIDLQVGSSPYFYNANLIMSKTLIQAINVPDSLNFGNVICDKIRTDFFRIKNNSPDTVRLTSIKILGYDSVYFRVLSPKILPISVLPFDSLSVVIQVVDSLRTGHRNAMLSMEFNSTDGTDSLMRIVALTANFEKIDFEFNIIADTIYFDSRNFDVKDTIIIIKNNSTIFSIISPALEGDSFSIDDASLSSPFDTSEVREIKVIFNPLVTNVDTTNFGTLIFTDPCGKLKKYLLIGHQSCFRIEIKDTLNTCNRCIVISLNNSALIDGKPPYEFLWQTLTGDTLSHFDSVSVVVKDSISGFIVQVTDITGFTTTDTIWVKISSPPDLIMKDKILCGPGCVKLEYEILNKNRIVEQSWSHDGVVFSNQASPIVMVDSTVKFKLVVIDSYGCISEGEITISMLKFPSVVYDTICSGHSIPIGPNNLPNFKFSHKWSPTVDMDSPQLLRTVVHPQKTTAYLLDLVVDSSCYIQILCDVYVIPPFNIDIKSELINGKIRMEADSGYSAYEWKDSTQEVIGRDYYTYVENEDATYILNVKERMGCDTTILFHIKKITISDIGKKFSNNSVIICPNPTLGKFTVELKEPQEGKIQIIDCLGRIIETLNTSKEDELYEFNLDFSPGVYLIKFQNGTCSNSYKLIVL